MSTEVFTYKRKLSTTLFAGGFFALGAIVIAHKAATNRRGLIINGFIRLSPQQADVFYWALAALSLGVFLIAAFLVVMHGRQRGFIELRDDAIVSPGRQFGSTVSTSYGAIRAIRFVDIGRQRFAVVHHETGQLSFPRGHFSSHAEFEDFVRALLRRSRTGG